jgi:hypothetical protein
MKEYVIRDHEKNSPFACEYCQCTFGLESILKTHLVNTNTRVKCDECNQEICNAFLFKMLQILPQPSNINFVQCSMSKKEKHILKTHQT